MNLTQAIEWCNKLSKGSLVYYVVFRNLNKDYIVLPQTSIGKYTKEDIVYQAGKKNNLEK